MGTGPPRVGNPRPWSASHSTTPCALASPNAEPPVNATASTCSTLRDGSSNATSRVAGAPPRTSPDPTVPGGHSTTVPPLCAPVQWPTLIPVATVPAVVRGNGPALTSRESSADFAHEVEEQHVELFGALQHD